MNLFFLSLYLQVQRGFEPLYSDLQSKALPNMLQNLKILKNLFIFYELTFYNHYAKFYLLILNLTR